MNDLISFANKRPTAGGTTVLRVGPVAAARNNQQPRISWGAILLKAIALTGERYPELKRCFMPLPWGHFYQHPHCVAAVVVERPWQGEHAVFSHQIGAPEQKSLREIDGELRWLKEAQVEALGSFRRLIRIARLPSPLRWLIWRLVLCGSGRLRSRHIGTFSLNSVPLRRGFATQSFAILSINFFYGPLGPDGDLPIQFFFDHRVIDGAAISRLFVELNAILCREIVAELNAGG